MSADSVVLKVFRYDPCEDITPRYKSYEIPYEEGMTVQIALKNIYENVDNTLAYKDTFCYSLQCYGCMVKLNGKRVRACATPLSRGQTVTVEPASLNAVIKDLVVNFKSTVPTLSFKNLYWNVVSTELCTSCGACINACPHEFIKMIHDIPVIQTMTRQDWCPVGDTIDCGACADACPCYSATD
jgi:succinate dehydrogenase/fumarate reductase-like Fe-S protein